MNYGKLTVVCGPMFSGKTTELLKDIAWHKMFDIKKVLVFKPRIDDRYSKTKVVTHNGIKIHCNTVDNIGEVFKIVFQRYKVTKNLKVYIDEVIFFDAENVATTIPMFLQNGIDVMVSGLDMMHQGTAWKVMEKLLPIADEIIKLKSVCAVCGEPATKTFKKGNLEQEFEVGSSDLYEPRCSMHWWKGKENEPG